MVVFARCFVAMFYWTPSLILRTETTEIVTQYWGGANADPIFKKWGKEKPGVELYQEGAHTKRSGSLDESQLECEYDAAATQQRLHQQSVDQEK